MTFSLRSRTSRETSRGYPRTRGPNGIGFKQKDRLRTAAEALRSSHDPDEGLSDESLVAEAASLRKRMESMATRTGGLVTSKGGGSSSPSSGTMAELAFKGNQQQAGEIGRMAARVNQIEEALKRRKTL